jgi:hypothetical protein
MRIRTWKDSTRLNLVFINRGGSAYSVLRVVIQAVPDGTFPKVEWDGGPIEVQPFGAQSLRLETPEPAAGSILIEAIPMGERWFALPEPGWSGHESGWLERAWRRITGWGRVPRGVSQELRGQGRPPSPEKPVAPR